MKKTLLMMGCGALFGLGVAKAQVPEAIYIATWVTMQDLGTPITPNENDPVLTYNPETSCYEGEIIDWPRALVNPYNAKIPYSVTDNVITYYGVDGPTQAFTFNTDDTHTYNFIDNTDPSKFKGFALSTANNTSVADVKISMNLTNNEITFTKFESGKGAVMPTLESIDPENGSEINLAEGDESFTVTFTFSGEVTGMEPLLNGIVLPSESNDDGTVWIVTVPINMVQASDDDDEEEGENPDKDLTQKQINIIVQKVYSGDLPVSFEDGKALLNLTYTVKGLPSAGIESINDSDGSLKVFNLNGTHVLTTKGANGIQNLKPGVYIVNGKKIMVK
ncbi:MAG: hypothetical protein J1E16_09480 [Muribaculaceae bacterium]|nr:hypothetical protein [Muribaculaceae bacterium]